MEFLNTQTIFGLTYLQLGGVLVGVLVVTNIFTRIFGDKTSNKMLKKRCRSCKWEGPAVATTKTCPKCQSQLHTVS